MSCFTPTQKAVLSALGKYSVVYYITDLAKSLNITVKEANRLTYAFGYRRGKHRIRIAASDYFKDPKVSSIVSTIRI